MTSPTQRTLAVLRADGWTAYVVERWNQYAKIRQDLGGFGDIIAWAPGRGVLIVQATTGAHVADRLDKIRDLHQVKAFMYAGGTAVEIWGWRKMGPRGARKTWQVRRITLSVAQNGRVVDSLIGGPPDAA